MRRKSVKATVKLSSYDTFETDIVDNACKLIDEWNELARKYKGGPVGFVVPAAVKERRISAERMPATIVLVYEFIKDNCDWQEMWNGVITAVNESAFLQGKTDSTAIRPSLGWLFMQSKIHGMQGEYKYKGMELILSGKYAGGIQAGEKEVAVDVSMLSKEEYAELIKKQEIEREERKKING